MLDCRPIFPVYRYRLILPILSVNIFKFTTSVILLALLPVILHAQTSVNSSLRHESAVFTKGDNEFTFFRNIATVNVNQRTQDWFATVSVQFRQNLLDSTRVTPALRFSEAFIEYSARSFDIRAGRQIISWGRSEAGFSSDFLTPLDLSEFLTQDFTDIRLGITSVKLTYYFGPGALEVITIPVPELSILPRVDSRWSLFPDNSITLNSTDSPAAKLKNVQYALRWIGRPNITTDFEIGVFSGFHQIPSLRKSLHLTFDQQIQGIQASFSYPRSMAIMLTGQHRLNSDLSLYIDAVFWQRRAFDLLPLENRSGAITQPTARLFEAAANGFLIEKPLITGMTGISTNLLATQVEFQYQFERILNYNADILQDETFHSVTILATRVALDDLLRLRFLSRYNINGNDIWLNADISYDIADGLQLSGGAHAFEGNSAPDFYGHLSFHQFRNNSFVYLKLTAWW